jgi:hypothetical protein
VRREGGKRCHYGPSPAFLDGVVFNLGTSGTVYAYEAKTGARKWQSESPGAAEAKKWRADRLAQRWQVERGAPMAWLGSLAVTPGRVIVPINGGLVGLDAADGRVLWHVADCIHELASPTIVRPEGVPLIVCANKGVARAIDPVDGRIAWKVEGIGPMQMSVPASDRSILLNVNGETAVGKDASNFGRWGAFRISSKAAVPAWRMPDDAVWFWPQDSGARRKVVISDGVVFITEAGHLPSSPSETPGYWSRGFAMLREEDGVVISARKAGGADDADPFQMSCIVPYYGIPRLIEDRLWVAADEAHGPAKIPVAFDQWRIKADGLELLHKNWQPTCEPATAYEVPIDWPCVDGRLYSRTMAGTIACYDLRRQAGVYRRYELQLAGAYHGSALPLPLRLSTCDGKLLPLLSAYPPDEPQAGLIFGKDRRFARWERADGKGLRQEGGHITGSMLIDHGTGTWPLDIDLNIGADGAASGTWSRSIPGLPQPVATKGEIGGKGPEPYRYVGTGWLKDQPWTKTGDLPQGTVCMYLCLSGGVPAQLDPAKGKDLHIYLDHDGKRFVRSLGLAFSLTSAWHEIDASRLVREGDRIHGSIEVCVNRDLWGGLAPDGGSLGGTVDLDARIQADGAMAGTYSARWGTPLHWSGTLAGTGVAAE